MLNFTQNFRFFLDFLKKSHFQAFVNNSLRKISKNLGFSGQKRLFWGDFQPFLCHFSAFFSLFLGDFKMILMAFSVQSVYRICFSIREKISSEITTPFTVLLPVFLLKKAPQNDLFFGTKRFSFLTINSGKKLCHFIAYFTRHFWWFFDYFVGFTVLLFSFLFPLFYVMFLRLCPVISSLFLDQFFDIVSFGMPIKFLGFFHLAN